MNNIYKIIYLITENSQNKKIIERGKVDEELKYNYNIYNQYNELIIDCILKREFNNHNIIDSIKQQVLANHSIITNYNYDISLIYIIDILAHKDIQEIDNLQELNEEFKYILLNKEYDKNIIIVENNYISDIKKLLFKEKIYKNIYFNRDFKKPIIFLIKEYDTLFN